MSLAKFLVAACTIGAVSAKAPKADQLTAEYSFSEYKRHFSKQYKDAAEHAKRQTIFESRLKEILAHNAAGRSYKMGVNRFTDMESAEVPKGNLLTQNMHLLEELKKKPYAGVHKMTGKAIPKSWDWRTQAPAVVTPVKDQGSCGDCWAHATVEVVESHWAIKHKQLWTLSQQQVTSCTSNPRQCGGTGGCAGAIYELGWDEMINATKVDKLASEWQYPFTSYYGKTEECKQNVGSTDVKVTGFMHLGAKGGERATDEELMDAIANVGPVAISVAADWSGYESGVLDSCKYPLEIDHAVVVVGYGTDEKSGMDFWTVRNSWSPDWGEDGYIRLRRYPSKEPCGDVTHNGEGIGCKGDPSTLKGVCGECGILMDPAYPVVASK